MSHINFENKNLTFFAEKNIYFWDFYASNYLFFKNGKFYILAEGGRPMAGLSQLAPAEGLFALLTRLLASLATPQFLGHTPSDIQPINI